MFTLYVNHPGATRTGCMRAGSRRWLPGCAVGGQRYAATAEGAVKAFCVNAINAEINSTAVAGGQNPTENHPRHTWKKIHQTTWNN